MKRGAPGRCQHGRHEAGLRPERFAARLRAAARAALAR